MNITDPNSQFPANGCLSENFMIKLIIPKQHPVIRKTNTVSANACKTITTPPVQILA